MPYFKAQKGGKGTYKLYGYHVDNSDSDPSSAISYEVIYDGRRVDNYYFSPAYMDFANDVFVNGTWNLIDDFFIPRPCMLKYNCEVDYYLDPDDVTKKEDGVTVSDVANTSYGGNAMLEWGRNDRKIWYALIPDESDPTSYTVLISDIQYDSNFHCWSFYDANDKQIDHFYTPIYEGSAINGVLRSISGQTPMNANVGATEISYAKANNTAGNNKGVEWYINVFADRLLINFLLVLISKSFDSQGKFGNGNYTGGSSASSLLTTGLGNAKGMFYGTTANGVVKVFGMENFWADRWERTAGLILSSGVMKYKLTYGTADGSTQQGYQENDSAPTGYLTGNTIATNLSNSKIVKQIAKSDGSLLPSVFAGSETTYYCDNIWSSTGVRYSLFGGCCAHGLACGAFALALNAALSYSGWYFGASLSCKPLA